MEMEGHLFPAKQAEERDRRLTPATLWSRLGIEPSPQSILCQRLISRRQSVFIQNDHCKAS